MYCNIRGEQINNANGNTAIVLKNVQRQINKNKGSTIEKKKV